jgi:hypothetical protein
LNGRSVSYTTEAMDLSKLPKLSQTDPPPADAPDAPQTPAEPPAISYRTPSAILPAGMGAEIWFNVIVAILAIFWGRSFAVYVLDTLDGKTFHTGFEWTDGDHAGQEIPYPQLGPYAMIGDAGLLFFGIVVLMETFLRAMWAMGWRVPRGVGLAVMQLAIGVTLFNLFVAIQCMREGIYPVTSGLAAAYGGFIVADLRRAMRTVAF